MDDLRCEYCNMSWGRAFATAMLISLGGRTGDPNHCNESDDNEHKWRKPDAVKEQANV